MNTTLKRTRTTHRQREREIDSVETEREDNAGPSGSLARRRERVAKAREVTPVERRREQIQLYILFCIVCFRNN